jgi:hypothetical protein
VGKVVVVADGFLGRWSQRKQAVQQGRVVDEPAAVKPTSVGVQAGGSSHAEVAPVSDVTSDGSQPTAIQATPPTATPTPTLADVNALNAESSFAPFVSREVPPEVRNAAMKKLFTDPHYNLMDGLDIYIDDYSKPDPMPASMLRQLASAKFLNLFNEEENAVAGVSTTPLTPQTDVNPATVASDPVGEPVPVLSDTPAAAIPQTPTDTLPAPYAAGLPAPEPHHDHTDLRLQPNDAAGRPQSERVPE